MQFKFLAFLVSVIMLGSTFPCYAFSGMHHSIAPVDSVGIKRVAGEAYIIHQVDQGETLFALSRKYNANVQQIRESNSTIDVDNLNIGDSLLVPLFPQLMQGRKTIHTVRSGETLFRISKTYKVTVEDLKKWNAIGQQALSIGQPIVIYYIEDKEAANSLSPIDEKKYVTHTVTQGETLFAISRAYGVSVQELKARNKLSNESINFGQQLIIREREVLEAPELSVSTTTVNAPTIPEPTKANTANSNEENEESEDEEEEVYDRRLTRAEALEQEKERIRAIRASEKKALSEYEKKSEMGFAAAIEGGIETKKFLALHRSAPVGTIMQIRNEMNNLSVFVRVVGKLPNTGVNDKVAIRISQAAYEKLGGINERFPVEITYIQ